jgi:prepilin-type N-terminal cleavage/methylation domain-containing protein
MNNKLRTNKAFTLIELLVAIGLLAIVISFAGVIFRVSINAYRTATANAEIMQKLRAITEQLDADFKGLRKDGEIFIVWSAVAKPGANPEDPNSYARFDRIMFFADGDFQSYGNRPMVRGNVARISYMLANRPSGGPDGYSIRAVQQEPRRRILARNLHILTADTNTALHEFLYPGMLPSVPGPDWLTWNNRLEYDKISLGEWKNIPWVIDPNNPDPGEPNKPNMLSVITDVNVANTNFIGVVKNRGSLVDPADPNLIHMLLCEGVGEFKIQGWYDALRRWLPEVDPDRNGDLQDTDFFLLPNMSKPVLDPERIPGVLYPYPPNGAVVLGGEFNYDPDTEEGQEKFRSLRELLNEEHFNAIPGLGRALKFTFTLYDSKGIIKEGRTFTHIVYLDD